MAVPTKKLKGLSRRELVREIRRRERELRRERRRRQRAEAERDRLRERLQWLRRERWGRKSERMAPKRRAKTKVAGGAKLGPIAPKTPRKPKGPKPLDPKLPRVTVKVADPDPTERICPVNGQPLRPGKTETIEVLACVPAHYYVLRYERTLWVSAAKSAPVYTPWPDEVLGPSRAHTSLLARLAGERFGMHAPYYRMERQAERQGVHLARSYQVSLMRQLDRTVKPLVEAIKTQVLGSRYLHVDATPIAAQDPTKRGAMVETTIWAFRAKGGAVWYQHEHDDGKSPRHPDRTLKEANFRGTVQVDGAAGLNRIGPPGQVTAYGCVAHARRPFYRALQAGEQDAKPYLHGFNRLFRIDRLAQYFRLNDDHRRRLRMRHSLPLFRSLVARARKARASIPPNLLLGQAVGYLLKQRVYLERCIKDPAADLSNNAVERSVRPLKLGARNWLHLGRPQAGSRLANIATLVQNCLEAGIDPERYLADVLPRLPGHPARRISELLPQSWKERQPAPASAAAA
jgi:transposase